MSEEKAIYVLEMNNPFLGGKEEQDLSEAMDIAIKAVKDKHCKSAILIPDGATNGDMIMAMFPNAKANVFAKEVGVKGLDAYSTFTKKWWNSPYEGGKE
jgi:hypothetical protein